MPKKVSSVEEAVKILEAGGVTISCSGEIGSVRDRGGNLSVGRPCDPFPLWVKSVNDMDMKILLSDGPVVFLSLAEIAAIYEKA